MENYLVLLPILLSSIMGFTNYLKGMREDSTTMKTSLIGGVRTFFLLSMSGLLSGWLYISGNQLYAGILTIATIALIVAYFAITAAKDKNSSFSDELSAILAHVLSFMWISGALPQQVLIAAFVGIIFILEQREFLVSLKERVNVKEFSQILIFLVIALIILPFLPNQNFSLHDAGVDLASFGVTNGTVERLSVLGLFNPYKLWFFVVFVSGLDIVGYLLKKAVSGSTSTLLSSMIGGFISSTSTTIGLATKSKKVANSNELVAGALLANVVSFVQIIVLVAPISIGLFKSVIPFLIALILSGSVVAIYFLRTRKVQTKAESTVALTPPDIAKVEVAEDAPIFQLGPAIKFATLLTVVKIVATISLEVIGSTAFIVTALIAALTGIDAITITLAELFNKASIATSMAVLVFVLINVVNLGSKVLYSFVSGSKEFASKFAVGISFMLIISVLVQVFIK